MMYRWLSYISHSPEAGWLSYCVVLSVEFPMQHLVVQGVGQLER
jgi:hypothetical protein